MGLFGRVPTLQFLLKNIFLWGGGAVSREPESYATNISRTAEVRRLLFLRHYLGELKKTCYWY